MAKPEPLPILQRLTCSVKDACAVSGLCERTIYERITAGTLKSKKDGANRLIAVASLLQMLGVDRDGNPIDGTSRARERVAG